MKLVAAPAKLMMFIAGAGLVFVYLFSLPDRLFNNPYCTVLEDRSGQLLSASIAADGQWRFPEPENVNDKFAKAIVAFEDQRFWNHPGLDVLAIGRALRQNVRKGRIVSGGSTLTMQMIRLSRHNPPRTFFQKILEVILATRAELRYTKPEILKLYASHAPFGGNVVGIEAACWRYFGIGSQDLSWGQAALLAVLPNNPSLIHLARNREILKAKRNRLLNKLFLQGQLDAVGFALATAEPVPDKPKPLPRLATHLLDRVSQEGLAQRIVRSSIDLGLQERTEQAVDDHYQRMKSNEIYNVAALILNVRTGEALAYAGNSKSGTDHQENVDVVRSPRSTGSILKPFLFAAMLNDGKILPKTLVPDVPTLIGGFAPKNFSKQFDGAVPADKALIRSLNVPVAHELKEYRYEKFYDLLRNIGMTTLHQPPDHYGLSLALGGAEGTLWEITGLYASSARTLNNYFNQPGKDKYHKGDFHSPRYLVQGPDELPAPESDSYLNAACLWLTFETLKELYRPGEESGWQHFSSAKPIAWKTGTSFGFRDGWAIGVNPAYAVGVWVGNADGEGRPGLTGTEAAAPLLFDLFSMLPGQPWFQQPHSELSQAIICSQSGQRAGSYCDKKDTMAVPTTGLASVACQYHKLVHLSLDGRYRVHGDCAPIEQIKTVGWFVLPPVQEFYFKSRNLSYRPLPPYKAGCANPSSVPSMDIVYPRNHARIYLPVHLDGRGGSTVFEATHRNASAVVYWHLDGQFIGSTHKTHRFSLAPAFGSHILTLVDDSGESLQRPFDVLSGR
jgi:penicillin-binding protein 1C